MNNWLTMLFNMGRGRRQPFFSNFRRRRNNRGMMLGSLIGMGISAALFGLGRNRNNGQNSMNNSGGGNVKMPNMGGLTEFAKEFVPNKNPQNNK